MSLLCSLLYSSKKDPHTLTQHTYIYRLDIESKREEKEREEWAKQCEKRKCRDGRAKYVMICHGSAVRSVTYLHGHLMKRPAHHNTSNFENKCGLQLTRECVWGWSGLTPKQVALDVREKTKFRYREEGRKNNKMDKTKLKREQVKSERADRVCRTWRWV